MFETASNAAKVSISDIGVWRLTMPVDAVNWVTGLQAGAEQGGRFTRQRQALAAGGQFELSSATRSSETAVPVVWFSGAPGSFFGGVNWSGAWKLQASGPAANGLVTIQVTLGDTATTVLRDQPLEGPHGFFGVARGDQSDVTLALQAYFRNGIRHGRPIEAPVTYNTWFAYGTRIDDEAIRDEMAHAARAGVELFMIDAGWYAGPDGVWDFSTGLGNWSPDPERFPEGLGPLSDYAHELGMKVGVWVEPERMDLATVYDLKLAKERFLATSGGRYHPEMDNGEATSAQICLGDAEAREWLLGQLVQLIDTARPDYLKWDNNYWINCDRADHGHGAKDGNFAHVKGLYAVLAALRERYPALSIENCAGGGNRLDSGMLQFTDSAWMDDVTAPSSHVRHNLEGLGTIFPPAYLLSFVTNGDFEPARDGSGGRALEFRSRMPGMLGLTWRSAEFGDEELRGDRGGDRDGQDHPRRGAGRGVVHADGSGAGGRRRRVRRGAAVLASRENVGRLRVRERRRRLVHDPAQGARGRHAVPDFDGVGRGTRGGHRGRVDDGGRRHHQRVGLRRPGRARHAARAGAAGRRGGPTLGPRAEHPRGQRHDGAQQAEHPAHRDPDQPERQQQQPHDRVEHERQERQRPAQHEQQQPQQELHHGNLRPDRRVTAYGASTRCGYG